MIPHKGIGLSGGVRHLPTPWGFLYGRPLGQFRDTEAANRDITDLPARKVA